MRKVIVLSINENPIYQFTLPLVVWSWVKIGWFPEIILIAKEGNYLIECVERAIGLMADKWSPEIIRPIYGFRTDTVAQVSRLYAASDYFFDGDYLMTGDSDMMALSDYWQFDPKKITVWGHDLTSYQQMPICYIGMMAERWREVMCLTNSNIQELMKRDLEEMPDSGENGNQVERWCTDQRLITKRINEVQFEKEFVHRGVLANGYPIGRIDRSAWATYHPKPIDAHLFHDIHSNDESYFKTMKMLASVFPNENFEWFIKYREEFRKSLSL